MTALPDANSVLRQHPIESVVPITEGTAGWIVTCYCHTRESADARWDDNELTDALESWYEHIGELLTDAQAKQLQAAFNSAREQDAAIVRGAMEQITNRIAR